MAKRKERIMPFFKFLAIAMAIITIITLCLFYFIDILPGEYFLVLCVLLILFNIIFSCLILVRRGAKRRAIGTVLSILYIILLVLVIIYELNTIGFLKKLGFVNYKTENYSVLVLKESEYEELSDLNDKTMGSLEFTSDGLQEAKEKIERDITIEFTTTNDITNLKESFLNEEYDSILIENSMLAMINESDSNFANSYKVIYEFSLDVETEDIANEVDINKDAFNIALFVFIH